MPRGMRDQLSCKRIRIVVYYLSAVRGNKNPQLLADWICSRIDEQPSHFNRIDINFERA